MEKDKIKKVKFLESEFKKLTRYNIFEDYLVELYHAFEQEIIKKYPESKNYNLIKKINNAEIEKKFKEKIFLDAQNVLKILTQKIDEHKELIKELQLSDEIIDFTENIRALIQIIINYYLTEDRNKYTAELKNSGIDINSIISTLFENFHE